MIWNEKIECADRAFFDKLTIERLQDLVKRCYENVPFYKKHGQQRCQAGGY